LYGIKKSMPVIIAVAITINDMPVQNRALRHIRYTVLLGVPVRFKLILWTPPALAAPNHGSVIQLDSWILAKR
jgi:hypothetical protein